jgi:hypothetical protein
LNYVNGTSIIFSRDIVESICKNSNKLRYDHVDDISIGFFIELLHKEIISNFNKKLLKYNAATVCNANFDTLDKKSDIVFFRNKRSNRYDDNVEMENISKYILSLNN